MMRSLYSGISGIKNHQTKMDVIGNNIANVNTTGYKKERVTFSTSLSQTMKGASAPKDNQGGTNAIQVGMGSMLGSIDKVMSQGSTQSTGNANDLLLQGTGFFVLENAGQTLYTRAGGFNFDNSGNLIDPATGAFVQGFMWENDSSAEPDFSNLSSIKFSIGDKLPLDSKLPVKNSSIPGSDIATTDLKGVSNLEIEGMKQIPAGETPSVGEYSFDPVAGTLTFATGFDATSINVEYVPSMDLASADDTITTFDLDYLPKSGGTVYVKHDDGAGTITATAYTPATDGTPDADEYSIAFVNGKYQITLGTAPSAGDKIGFDFLNEPHTLTDYSIDQSGTVTGVYSDGYTSITRNIAKIAVATFSNEAGLVNNGNNFFTESNNSGTANIGGAGEQGRALIIPNAVEMSNVDLSQEFTDMIVTQRGFQANSRVITVSDTLLQELIDLKR